MIISSSDLINLLDGLKFGLMTYLNFELLFYLHVALLKKKKFI